MLWIPRERLALGVLRGAVFLTLLSAGLNVVEVATDSADGTFIAEMAGAFNVVPDGTVPTWFSSMILLIAAILLWVAGSHCTMNSGPGRRAYWRVLSVGFGLMSIDETATFHEKLNGPLDDSVVAGGAFHFAWVVAAIPFVLIIAAVYWRWLLHLDPAVGLLMTVSAIVFITGAIVLEMASGVVIEQGWGTSASGGVSHVEELFEMLGVGLFIEAVLRHLRLVGWQGTLSLGSAPPRNKSGSMREATSGLAGNPAPEVTAEIDQELVGTV